MEEVMQEKRYTITRNSEKEVNFISELINTIENIELINTIENIDTSSTPNKESFENIAQDYVRISESIWYNFS